MIFDLAIIGAGVVGLSIAKSCSELGMSVLVLEQETRSGEGISSRNSGVIHAGIFYPTGSLKSKLCVEGNEMLYEYALKKNISCKKIGKYVIASEDRELDKLRQIYNQGNLNGATLTMCSKDEITAFHPDLRLAGAMYSPQSGIIDVPELITALEGDIQHNKGIISLNTKFISAERLNDHFKISCNDGNDFDIKAKGLVNSSGLASEVNSRKIHSLDSKYNYPVFFAKGHYFKYSGNHPFSSLIYPLADEFSQGIHVGFDMSGQLKFGPDINWVDDLDYSFDESVKDNFIKSIHKYWPSMDPNKLQPDYVGIRPKIQNRNGRMRDFSILDSKDHGVDGLINLQGIESPGVTSCLALGTHVASAILR